MQVKWLLQNEIFCYLSSVFATQPEIKLRIKNAVDHFKPGILAWVLKDHSAETFHPLSNVVAA